MKELTKLDLPLRKDEMDYAADNSRRCTNCDHMELFHEYDAFLYFPCNTDECGCDDFTFKKRVDHE